MNQSHGFGSLLGGLAVASVCLGCSGGTVASLPDDAADEVSRTDTGSDASSDASSDAPSTPEVGEPDGSAPDADDGSVVADASDAADASGASDTNGGDVVEVGPSDAPGAAEADAPASEVAVDAPIDTGCASDQKLCAASCVPKRDPGHGCGGASCSPCAIANASATCDVTGACAIDACVGTHADCDKLVANGCETDVAAADNDHCGACGHTCATGCVAGTCPAAKPTARVPDSARSWCSDGRMAITCPVTPSAPAFGQDGSYELYVPHYVLSSSTVYDPVSGLVWERDTPAGSFTETAAKDHCDGLAKSSFAGYVDWRLPTIHELVTLIDEGGTTLAGGAFPTLKAYSIRSSSELLGTPTSGYELLLSSQGPNVIAKNVSTARTVKCVRGATASGGLSASASGNLVTDTRTSLEWQRVPFKTPLSWLKALDYCNSLVLDGAGGFRLPSFKELFTTIDLTKSSPSQDPLLGAAQLALWTSSLQFEHFDSGGVTPWPLVNYGPTGFSAMPQLATDAYYVRCVRSLP